MISIENEAKQIFKSFYQDDVEQIERLTTGQVHFVFKVASNKQTCVVRIAKDGKTLKGALYCSEKLKPLGLPTANIFHADLEARYPYLILEYIQGKDLGVVYSTLTEGQRKELAQQIVSIQNLVHTLPEGIGYGWSFGNGIYPYRSWIELIYDDLEKSKEKINKAKIADDTIVDIVKKKLAPYDSYFSGVRSIPFLDDTTVKNVLIDNGSLAGIVDVDCICYGDPLFTPALTKMGILSDTPKENTDYINYWCDELQLSPFQRTIIDVYTTIFCVGFISNIGQTFNDDKPFGDRDDVAHLKNILSELTEMI